MMTLPAVEVLRPETVADAVEALKAHPGARVLDDLAGDDVDQRRPVLMAVPRHDAAGLDFELANAYQVALQRHLLIGELDAFMAANGFRRTVTMMAGSTGWGDALYVREARLRQRSMRAALAQSMWRGQRWFGGRFPILRRIAGRQRRR